MHLDGSLVRSPLTEGNPKRRRSKFVGSTVQNTCRDCPTKTG